MGFASALYRHAIDFPAKLSNGYIVDRVATAFGDVVTIATGFVRPSQNPKTGAMIQLWHLLADVDPVTAVRTGADEAICGACPLRSTAPSGKNRPCYVDVTRAPLAVWRAFKRGAYPVARPQWLPLLFADRGARFGAYGDPSTMSTDALVTIAKSAATHTGYTHNWRNLGAPHRHYLMASVDSPAEYDEARALGWRTFGLVESIDPAQRPKGSALCPSLAGRQCADCKLCSGSLVNAKSIVIPAHGAGAADALRHSRVDRMRDADAEAICDEIMDRACDDRAFARAAARTARERRRTLAAMVGAHNVRTLHGVRS